MQAKQRGSTKLSKVAAGPGDGGPDAGCCDLDGTSIHQNAVIPARSISGARGRAFARVYRAALGLPAVLHVNTFQRGGSFTCGPAYHYQS